MIEPLQFGFNEEAANYNFLQKPLESLTDQTAEMARTELLSLVSVLKKQGINVLLARDEALQQTPSSVYPASWISLHEDSRVVAYPLACTNRKAERRGDLLNFIVENDFPIYDITDISASENEGRFLHGADSVVLDRINQTAYAALSPIADKAVFLDFCEKTGYRPFTFSAKAKIEDAEFTLPTSMILCIANNYAMVCIEAITTLEERNALEKQLAETGKTIVEISIEQALKFAGNGLQLSKPDGKTFLLLSESAFNSLNHNQKEALSSFNEIVTVQIDTIEQVGGAGIRSMIAEIFLPH